MSKFESEPNLLTPDKSQDSIELKKEKELTPEELEKSKIEKQETELSSEELAENIEKNRQQDAERLEIIRRELKEMQLTDAERKSSQAVEAPSVDINTGKKLLEEDEGIPFTLISTKRLNELSYDYRWKVEDPMAAIRSELEKRKNRNPAVETFLNAYRSIGRGLYHIWDNIQSIAGIHFEERSPEDALRRAEKLKESPFLHIRRIAEAEEKKIKDKIENEKRKK